MLLSNALGAALLSMALLGCHDRLGELFHGRFPFCFRGYCPKLVIETIEWQTQRIGVVSSSRTDLRHNIASNWRNLSWFKWIWLPLVKIR